MIELQGLGQDITQRKQAEESLKRSEEKYRSIVEIEPECVKLLDAEGRILELNPAGLKLIGVESFEDVKGQSVFDLISPENRDAYRKLHTNIFQGIPGALELEIIRASGERRIVQTSAVPMYDAEGNISAHLAITRDTTEQHRILKRLELTQFALDNSSISTFWVRKDGRFAYVNDVACRILGYSREELLGMTVSDIDPVFPQDDWPEHWAEMKQAGSMTFEALHRARNGRVYPVEITTNYLKYEDEEYIWAFSTDISEKKQAQDDLVDREAKLQAIVDTAAEGIITIDERGIVKSFNRASERIFGYSADEIIGRNVSLLMPEAMATNNNEYIENYLRTGQSKIIGIGREVIALRKDGSTFPLELAVSETRIGDTRLFIGLCRDITERVEMERERKMLESQLLQAQKIEAVGTLATGVAHDISNALTVILGYTTLLREQYTDDPNIIEAIHGIDLASHMASDVAHSLLTFSRKGEIDKDRINLVEITSEISNLLKRLLPSSIQLHINVDHESDPIWISGNVHQIQQVLVNLSVNARDAMPEGGSLSISFDRVSSLPPGLAQQVETPRREYVCIQVTDTGVGMTPETLASVYDPFFTTKSRGQGTGLGMSIVHGIISDHDGFITIESAPGEGTRVSFCLPLLPAATSEIEIRDPRPVVEGRGRLVLLAEDEYLVAMLVSSILERHGFNVLCAHDGEHALRLFDQHEPDLALAILDYNMPTLNGAECLERMRTNREDLPAIIMSGYCDDDCMKLFPRDVPVLSKPFDPVQLMAQIRTVLKQSSATMKNVVSQDARDLPRRPGPRH